jgi:zinc transport system permease protein
MIEAILHYRFLQNALMAAVLASIVCGVIGVIIIEKKWVMMSGGIAHTAYGGVGLGYLCGFEPILGALLFAVLSAFGIGLIKRRSSVRAEVITGLFWSIGMALGVLFIAAMPGYPPDLSSYLFGNILAVTRLDLVLAAILTALVLLVVVVFYQHWKLYIFDEEYAAITGLPTAILEYLLLVLVALAVVVMIRTAGIILVLALLITPAALAGLFTRNLLSRMLVASFLGILFCLAGLWISYLTNAPTGAVIVVLAAVCFFLAFGVRALIERGHKKSQSRTP